MTKILELPITELKHALAGLAKVIATRSTLPILSHVRIESAGPETVTLQGTDLEAYATCRIAARNPDDFPACALPLDQLSKLAKASKGDLALLVEDDGKFAVRYPIGGTLVRTSIDSLPVAECPVPPVVKSPAHPMDEGFKVALQRALECVSHEGARYVIQGACLDISQSDCHTVVGTNGRHLFAANTFTFQLATSVIVPDRKFLHWFDFAADGPWSLAVEPNEKSEPAWIKLQSNRWTFVTKAIEGVYSNWRQVEPHRPFQTNITFSTAAVESILEALPCLPTDNKGNLPVCLEIQNNEFQLKGRARDNDDWTIVPIPGVRLIGQPVGITINRTYLSKALRFGLNELEINSDTEPVVFSAPGRKMIVSLICPVKPAEVSSTDPATTTATPDEPNPVGTPSAGEPENPTQERKSMTTNTAPPMTAPARGDLKPDQTGATSNGNSSATKALIDQLDTIRTALKDLAGDLTSTIDLVKAAEKEKKTALKEVENVRATLRSLQKVQL